MVDLVHDEICIEYPKELVDVDKKLEKIGTIISET